MTFHQRGLGKLALSTFLLTLPLNAALAQDVTAIADRLKANLVDQGIDIGWSNITGDASEMILEGVTVKPAGEAQSLPIGNVTLSDVEETDGGGFYIGTLATQPFSRTEDGMTLDMSEFVITGMNVPGPNSTDPLDAIMLYEGAELDSMTVQAGGKTAFSLNGLAFEMTRPEDGKPMEFTGAAEKFTADLSLVEDPQSKAVIDALGYGNISGFLEVAGSWHPQNGELSLSQYDITVDNAGTLGMTFDLGGYTLDFIKSMQDMSKKMAEAPAGADNSASGLAMLGLMQQLSLSGATVRWDDDSLTNKVLDYLGKQQGLSGKDVANQAKAMVPIGLMQLGDPDLVAQASAAVNAYLDNPQNIEIASAPASPVPFAVIMSGAMANPASLVKTFGLKVTANQ